MSINEETCFPVEENQAYVRLMTEHYCPQAVPAVIEAKCHNVVRLPNTDPCMLACFER